MSTPEPLVLNFSIDTNIHANYMRRHGSSYREPIEICNEYMEYGGKHSYKYTTNNSDKFKKRKWKYKHYCDDNGDDWDEEDDIGDWDDGICHYSQEIAITICKINCFNH